MILLERQLFIRKAYFTKLLEFWTGYFFET